MSQDSTSSNRYGLREYEKMAEMLLKTINSVSAKNLELPTEGSDAHMLGTEYLPLLAEEDVVAQVEGLVNLVQAFGVEVFQQAWSFLSATASVQLQTGLILTANVQKQLDCGNRFCALTRIKLLCNSLNHSTPTSKELQTFVPLLKSHMLALVFSSETLSLYCFQSL